MSLQFREFITTDSPKRLMILLHGYGSNADDLISLAPDLVDALPDTNFISPNAPFKFEAGFGNAYQWYSLIDRSESAKFAGALEASPYLVEFINQQLKRFNLGYADLILSGFSQGGMMTLHNAIRFEEKILAAICFSGYLCDLDNLDSAIKSRPNILITHGDEDNVVPIEAAKNALAALIENNVPVEHFYSRGLGHGIDNACLRKTKEFLKDVVA